MFVKENHYFGDFDPNEKMNCKMHKISLKTLVSENKKNHPVHSVCIQLCRYLYRYYVYSNDNIITFRQVFRFIIMIIPFCFYFYFSLLRPAGNYCYSGFRRRGESWRSVLLRSADSRQVVFIFYARTLTTAWR